MLTVFWNLGRVVLADFLEKETTINSRYIATLTALKRRIKGIGIRNETLLQHNNPRPHTGAAIRDAIQHLDFQCYLIHCIAKIWLRVISTCSQN